MPVVEQSIQDVELDVEKAMSVGIIVNELLTNVFKHGISGVPEPRIRITLLQGDKLFEHRACGRLPEQTNPLVMFCQETR